MLLVEGWLLLERKKNSQEKSRKNSWGEGWHQQKIYPVYVTVRQIYTGKYTWSVDKTTNDPRKKIKV